MFIKFSMDEINNMDLLYTWTEENSEEYGRGCVEHYHGDEYCKSIISDTLKALSNTEEIEQTYSGSRERIANEVFELFFSDGCKYTICFSINTYDKQSSGLVCSIICQDSDCYDKRLEKIKILLKDRLLIDWKECTWQEDTQSVALCTSAFERIVIVENNLRSLVGKILIHFLGVNWIKRSGMEKESQSVELLKEKFVNRVSEFMNINTDFMSMTLETLVGIMFNGVIYKDNIVINRNEYAKIIELGEKNNQGKNIANFIKSKRVVEKEIWKDLFIPFIEDPDLFKTVTHSFIEDRNHVAHSKVLSWNAYQVIEKDISEMERLIDSANIMYEQEVVSDESVETWIAQSEQDENEREFLRTYYRDRISSETGMEILNEKEILNRFDETIQELYNNVFQCYHFDLEYSISGFTSITKDSKCFSVSSTAVEDGSAIVEILAEYTIDDDLSGDSECVLKAINAEEDVLFDASIRFHNGNGSEGESGLFEATDITDYDISELDEFREYLYDYLNNSLNPYPAILDALVLQSKGAETFVASFPCEQCGKFGVSINESFIRIGQCCFCGWKNEVRECLRCGELVNSDSLDNGLCQNCIAYVERE